MQLNTRKTNNPIKKWGKDLNRHFSREYIQMAINTWKDAQHCPLWETQIKTPIRYHFTMGKMAIIIKFTNNKCWRRCGEKGNLLHCWWKCKLIQPLWRFLKIKPPYDPAIPLLGIYPEKTIIEKDTCTPMFIAAWFTWKWPRCPSTDEWLKMLGYIYSME